MKINIVEILYQTDSPQRFYELFKSLGYPKDKVLDPTYKRKVDEFDLAKEERQKVREIYTVFNYDGKLQIFLFEVKSLSVPFIRYLTRHLADRYLRFLLCLTTDYKEYCFVFSEFETFQEGKHRLKITRLNFDRTEPYHTDLLTLSNLALTGEQDNWRDIWRRWKDAFSVQRVTDQFFEDYKTVFFELRQTFEAQKIPVKSSHELAQQVLNRLMFVYFISKKRWLNDNPKFIKWYWHRYRQEKGDRENTFYDKWLKVLFLEAFNNRYSHPSYHPQDVRNVLASAPYLNGGLFHRNELDDLPFSLSDSLFERIFNFFEKYNFTIREDLPLDVEVAVDPKMIGYVYESLSNVAEEIYERQDLGIFYTPTIEVDFMCRRVLVEYLSKHLLTPTSPTFDNKYPFILGESLKILPLPLGEGRGEGRGEGEGEVSYSDKNKDFLSKTWIYRLLFDEDKKVVADFITKHNLWYKIEEALDNLAVVDPACGSGAFVVGMLAVLTELYNLTYNNIKRQMSQFELKKKIIGNCLYGVDVMPWAVHSAELRLWLQLIIDEDIPFEMRKLYPLLPNLNLKLRVGDSLVQEIGGISLHLRDSSLSPSSKKKLSSLKTEKEKYYNNDPTAKFKTKEAFQHEELRIFTEILDDRIFNLQKTLQSIEGRKSGVQLGMFDNAEKEHRQITIFDEQIKAIKQEIEGLNDTKSKIHRAEHKPFVWDIDFAEIFGDKGGFDIVIGNPPYVRQEKIAPPNILRSEVTNQDKTLYKDKLLKSIQTHYPFIKRIDKKSDYYIYFYLHGLSLLNDKGTFCFITSNSWLDVGYGKDLQEFLLKYCPIIAIYDNEAKRSFEHADVNTVIALFGAPVIRRNGNEWTALQHTARFVMFKKPFEEVVNTSNIITIDKATEVTKTEAFRVYPILQETLLEEGWEMNDPHPHPHPYPLPEGEGIALQSLPSILSLPPGDSQTIPPLPEGEGIALQSLPSKLSLPPGDSQTIPPLPEGEGIALQSLPSKLSLPPGDSQTIPPLPEGEGRGEGFKKPPLPPHLIKTCRELRKNLTDAEKLLWHIIRNKQLNGLKFRRQHPFGNYILDFYCHELKLALELDGGGHTEPKQIKYDNERTKFLESQGIRVLRFWNNDVLTNIEGVVEVILEVVGEICSNSSPQKIPLPDPLPKGEGIKSSSKENIVKETQRNSLFREKFVTGQYIGNKWGGKYLRAPEIYFKILEKGKGKLVRLGDVAEVRRGITTGCNEFFYLDKERIKEWGIEDEFLKPVIKSPRECKSILINPKDLRFKVFMCHKDKKDLKGTNALKYIEWGERQGFHERPSCAARQRWWECPDLEGNMFWAKETNDRLGVFLSDNHMLCDCRLYYADGDKRLQNSINSTLSGLISEILARGGLGEGAKSLMVYEVNNLLILNPSLLKTNKVLLDNRDLNSIYDELGINPSLPIREQKPNPLPDRKALDDIVFDILGLTEDERNEVYWAVCELVKNRLEKARSV